MEAGREAGRDGGREGGRKRKKKGVSGNFKLFQTWDCPFHEFQFKFRVRVKFRTVFCA